MERHVDSLRSKLSVSLSAHLYYQPANLLPIIYLYTGTIGLSYHRSPTYLPGYHLATNVQRVERDMGWLLVLPPAERRHRQEGKKALPFSWAGLLFLLLSPFTSISEASVIFR